jgi:hypothetical protein
LEVVDILSPRNDATILELEHDAGVGVEPLPVAHAAAVVQTDDPPVLSVEHRLELGLESSGGLLAVCANRANTASRPRATPDVRPCPGVSHDARSSNSLVKVAPSASLNAW